MNTASPDTGPEPAHRFVDATLREHARAREAGSDDALVRSILAATVEAPARSGSPAVARPEPGRHWLIAGSAAAALVAVLAALLATLPFSNGDRNHTEIQLVVNYPSPAEEIEASDSEGASPNRIAARPYQGEIELMITTPGSDASSIPEPGFHAEWSYPLAYSAPSARASGSETLSIDSDAMDSDADYLVYSGDVELRYRSLRISADRLKLRKTSGDTPQPENASRSAGSLLTAENAVLVSESGNDFPISEARAGLMEFDPISGLIRLREIDRFETVENGVIELVDSQVVSITAAGYSIESPR